MTTLSANKSRDIEFGCFKDYPVIASDIVYQGAAVGENGSGYARPLVAGDLFLGFCSQKADNSTGGAGDINVRTRKSGDIVLLISSLAITDIGKAVYASDDDTFTLTETGNSYIGYVSSWVSTGVGVVSFECGKTTEAALTDNSSGTASDTIAAIGATYDQDEVRNAIASLAAKINHILKVI